MICVRFCWLGEVSWEVCIVNWNSLNAGVIFSFWEFRRTGNKTVWALYREVDGVRGKIWSSLSISLKVIIYLGFLSTHKAIVKSLMLKRKVILGLGCYNKLLWTWWLKLQIFISHGSGGCEIQNQRHKKIQCLVRVLFLFFKWLSSCIVTWRKEKGLPLFCYKGTDSIMGAWIS